MGEIDSSKVVKYMFLVICVALLVSVSVLVINVRSGVTSEFVCVEKELGCYKHECTIFGCGKLEVDVNSSQCELKEEICREWGFR